jgi:hypothetical protein
MGPWQRVGIVVQKEIIQEFSTKESHGIVCGVFK